MTPTPEEPAVAQQTERDRTLEALFSFPTQEYRRSIPLLVSLLATAVLFVASIPLPWHHHVIPAAGYTVIYGIQGSNWLLAVAAICIGIAIRQYFRPPGYYLLALLAATTFAAVIGMYADYVDSQDRAAQLYVPTYVGAGFYLALPGLLTLALALALAWRNRL